MTLGENIYTLRTDSNMSQGVLANALDVSRQSVSKWETNASVPDLDKLVRLSEVFGVSLDELVRGEKPVEINREAESSVALAQKVPLATRKIIGLILLGFGLFLFILLSLLTAPLAALILASPLLICAAICLLVNRHTVFWCCWALYVHIYSYLRYATGIRFWWIFEPGIYRSGMEIHALIAWAMALGLIGLVIVSGRIIIRSRKKP